VLKHAASFVSGIEERKEAKARAELEAAKNKTFRECAAAYIEANRAGWARYCDTVQTAMKNNVIPMRRAV